MLSVIIPSWKDPLLHKTIDSLLNNATGEIEIIPVLDGYWPEKPIKSDPSIRVLHIGENGGMRRSINAGIRIAKGEFIMRLDEHCKFAKGYDVALTSVCKPNWIVTAPQYFLDPIKWKRMDIEPVLCQKLVIQSGKKFSGQRWKSRDEKFKNESLVETMAMQGSMWITPRKWFNEVIVRLETEGYGPAYQDSHEAVFKTWKVGGKLMLNKDTWFAHKHRSFSRTHQEGTPTNPWVREQSWAHGLKVWGDYYKKEIKPKWKI